MTPLLSLQRRQEVRYGRDQGWGIDGGVGRGHRGEKLSSLLFRERAKKSLVVTFSFFSPSFFDLVSLFLLLLRGSAGGKGKIARAMSPSPRPSRPRAWRSKPAAAVAAMAMATATATLLLTLLLLKASEGASAAISSSSSSSTTSSAAASVSLHAKWDAAPLVLEAVEFLVSNRVQSRSKGGVFSIREKRVFFYFNAIETR